MFGARIPGASRNWSRQHTGPLGLVPRLRGMNQIRVRIEILPNMELPEILRGAIVSISLLVYLILILILILIVKISLCKCFKTRRSITSETAESRSLIGKSFR